MTGVDAGCATHCAKHASHLSHINPIIAPGTLSGHILYLLHRNCIAEQMGSVLGYMD